MDSEFKEECGTTYGENLGDPDRPTYRFKCLKPPLNLGAGEDCTYPYSSCDESKGLCCGDAIPVDEEGAITGGRHTICHDNKAKTWTNPDDDEGTYVFACRLSAVKAALSAATLVAFGYLM